MRYALSVGAFLLSSAAATASTINLNDFYSDPEVTVSADGLSASFVETQLNSSVLLANDPGLGDPTLITPAVGAILSFTYNFTLASGNNDAFTAFIVDTTSGGPVAGSGFSFDTTQSQSGTVSFDLSSFVGQTIGLQFELSALPNDQGFDSTLSISNLQIVTEVAPVPLPAGAVLLLTGVAGLAAARRRAS